MRYEEERIKGDNERAMTGGDVGVEGELTEQAVLIGHVLGLDPATMQSCISFSAIA